MATPPPSDSNPLHVGLYLGGGLCLGAGIMLLNWSFGRSEGTLNADMTKVGFSGLDNIAILGAADFSLPLVAIGACCLVLANVGAWKETGGY